MIAEFDNASVLLGVWAIGWLDATDSPCTEWNVVELLA